MTTSPIITAALRYKQGLLAYEKKSVAKLIRYYGNIYAGLAGDIAALEAAIRETPDGQATFSQDWQLEKLHSLTRQIEHEVSQFAKYAGQEMIESCRDVLPMALQHAQGMAKYSGAPGLRQSFALLPVEAIESMVGFMSEGSPLHMGLTERLGPEVASRVEKRLVDAVGLGINPYQVAGQVRNLVRDQLGLGLTWAMTTSRTAIVWSYREAKRLTYAQNGVEGYYWLCARDGRVCMGCVALDGAWFPIDQPLNDHHNGRCTEMPAMKGETFAGQDTGEDWFRALEPTRQLEMMGPGKFDLWQSGRLQFSDLVAEYNDPIYGAMRRESTLKALLEKADQDGTGEYRVVG